MAAAVSLCTTAAECDDWSDFSDSRHDFSSEAERADDLDCIGTLEYSEHASVRLCDPVTVASALALFRNVPEDRLPLCADNSRWTTAHPHMADMLKENPTWWKLTRTIGNAMPVDWSKCRAREMQLRVLRLRENQAVVAQNFDGSDDEELSQAFDVHRIVTSKAHKDDDEVETADEVISQLDNIIRMQESMMTVTTDDGYITECDMMSSAGSDCLYFRDTATGTMQTSLTYEDTQTGLKQLSSFRLNELLDDIQNAIEERSTTLVRELALRDELEYELELKNQFITLCHNVMKKQKSRCQATAARRKSAVVTGQALSPKASKRTSQPPKIYEPVAPPAMYLIPYEAGRGPPDGDLLNIYIKILSAMYNESPTVPTLLTDYILKVVCPT